MGSHTDNCRHLDSVVLVSGLRIVTTRDGLDVAYGVTLSMARGEVLGLVGESGCGKSTLGLSLLGFVRPGLSFAGGSVHVCGHDIFNASDNELRELRGRMVSYVPQDSMTSLNPGLRVEQQFHEVLTAHGIGERAKRRERITELLRQVDLPANTEFLRRYPHQLSGGQQQRVAIAMSFACKPSVVVMDEPTTGLDVATQLKVLEAVDTLRKESDTAVLFISHDLSMLAGYADRLAVMYAGGIVEMATAADLRHDTRHPYTFGLFEAIPDPSGTQALVGIPGNSPPPSQRSGGCSFAPRCRYALPSCSHAEPLLTPVHDTDGSSQHGVDLSAHLVRCFRSPEIALVPEEATSALRPAKTAAEREALLTGEGLVAWHGRRRILDHVDVRLPAAGSVALVGESGSGKTTLARCLVGLHAAFEGDVRLSGQRLARKARSRSRNLRRLVQYVFQNPYSSLNPRKSIASIVAQPLKVFFGTKGREARDEVVRALTSVGLGEEYLERYPHELSGGERQRVALARALIAQPAVLICDEVTSSLDVSVQAVTVNLLRELQLQSGVSMLFITHNLPLVRHIADWVMVLRAGKLVEEGSVDRLFSCPSDPYTRSLLLAGTDAWARRDSSDATHLRTQSQTGIPECSEVLHAQIPAHSRLTESPPGEEI